MDKCHETIRRPYQIPTEKMATGDIYTHLLPPFTDVFCFFSADLGGFSRIMRYLARQLEKGYSPAPKTMFPSVVIVADEITPRVDIEAEARTAFLSMLSEETVKDSFSLILVINVISLFLSSTISIQARYRRLKERLIERLDKVRRFRKNTQMLFSVAHFAAFIKYAAKNFSDLVAKPFDFVRASRIYNPVPADLNKHLSNFLNYITSSNQFTEFTALIIASTLLLDSYPPRAHRKYRSYNESSSANPYTAFDPKTIFNTLYKEAFYRVSRTQTISFPQLDDIILRAGFINIIKNNFIRYFNQHVRSNVKSAAEIYNNNLMRFQNRQY